MLAVIAIGFVRVEVDLPEKSGLVSGSDQRCFGRRMLTFSRDASAGEPYCRDIVKLLCGLSEVDGVKRSR